MTEQEVQEIYSRLLELTKAGKVKWEKTGEKEFTANFSRSSVSVEKEEQGIEGLAEALRGEFKDRFALNIYNDAGLIVAYANNSKKIKLGLGVKTFKLDPSELYHLVEESIKEDFYKYSETSRSILDDLKELELSEKGK